MTTDFITAYGPKRKIAISFAQVGRTKQSHADESNINFIMAKYLKTGILNHANAHKGVYDYASENDFQTSINIVLEAQSMFDALPSAIRNRFDNEPARFLKFVQNEKNEDEIIKMGLATPRRDARDDKGDLVAKPPETTLSTVLADAVASENPPPGGPPPAAAPAPA